MPSPFHVYAVGFGECCFAEDRTRTIIMIIIIAIVVSIIIVVVSVVIVVYQ